MCVLEGSFQVHDEWGECVWWCLFLWVNSILVWASEHIKVCILDAYKFTNGTIVLPLVFVLLVHLLQYDYCWGYDIRPPLLLATTHSHITSCSSTCYITWHTSAAGLIQCGCIIQLGWEVVFEGSQLHDVSCSIGFLLWLGPSVCRLTAFPPLLMTMCLRMGTSSIQPPYFPTP